MLLLATFLQSRGFGPYNKKDRGIVARRNLTDTICTNIQAQIKPDRLSLLDVGLGNFTSSVCDAHTALKEGVKMVHATPKETLPGGLLPMTFKIEDSMVPERAVAELWCTSGIRRAVEHTLDSHGSAVHVNGMRIILFGPGARDWLHAKMIAKVGSSMKGSSIGSDFVTTMPLRCEDPQQPWNLGKDAMVISVASPQDKENPLGASILHDRLLDGVRADNALAACNAVYDAQKMGCGHNDCKYSKEGCSSCRRRGIEARLPGIATPRYEHGTHSLVGMKFLKKFDDGIWYGGKITSWKRGRYRLEYDNPEEKTFKQLPVTDAEEMDDPHSKIEGGQISKRFKLG